MDPAGINVLITGTSGFLGKALVKEFLGNPSKLRVKKLVAYDINDYNGPSDERIVQVKGDILDLKKLTEAASGMEMVVHSAAIVDWGTRSEEEVYAVNVTGTENVIEACRAQKVPVLVYTSSLDAIYGGKPLVDIDESIPYPGQHVTMYCKSKCEGEKRVMAANDGSLKTVVLRPSDIYGEGDPYHIGSLLEMAKGGFYIRLGDGKAKCQHVYVDNMAWAHVLAGAALLDGGQKIAGKPYLITDAPGTNFFTFYDRVVEGAGYRIRPKNLWIPRGVAMAMGAVSEGIAILARPVKKYNPKFSRFAVTYTCSDFTFLSNRAREDFGYEPKYPEPVAVERTIAWYKAQREESMKK